MTSIVEDETRNIPALRPPRDGNEPVEVFLSVYVIQISNVNIQDKEFTVDAYFWQSWQDSRLNSSYVKSRVSMTNHFNKYGKIWTPDTYFSNEKRAFLHKVTVPNVGLKIDPGGVVFYSQRITATFSCQFDMAMFPFDDQYCHAHIESVKHTFKDLVFKWKDGKSVANNHKILLPEFEIIKTRHFACESAQSTKEDNYTCLGVGLHLRRLSSTYFTHTFVPSVLIVAVSWLQFWIDFHLIQARIVMGLFPILSLQVLHLSIQKMLPDVSSRSVTSLDVFLLGCAAFVVVAFLEYVLLHVLHQVRCLEPVEEEEHEHTQPLTKAFPPSMPLIHRVVVYCTTADSALRPVLYIDLVCRVVFPLSFLFFNVCYWPLHGPNIIQESELPSQYLKGSG